MSVSHTNQHWGLDLLEWLEILLCGVWSWVVHVTELGPRRVSVWAPAAVVHADPPGRVKQPVVCDAVIFLLSSHLLRLPTSAREHYCLSVAGDQVWDAHTKCSFPSHFFLLFALLRIFLCNMKRWRKAATLILKDRQGQRWRDMSGLLHVSAKASFLWVWQCSQEEISSLQEVDGAADCLLESCQANTPCWYTHP